MNCNRRRQQGDLDYPAIHCDNSLLVLLDENAQRHVELGRLLEEMMAVQNMYLGKHNADIESVFSVMGGASKQAAVVLAQEWEKVGGKVFGPTTAGPPDKPGGRQRFPNCGGMRRDVCPG